VAASGAGGPALAQDGEPLVAQQCIQRSLIRRTKILDDRNILFYMRNGVVYNNVLPRQCPSLNPGTLLGYSYRGGQLCADSSVQVYWQMDTRRIPAFLCRIGMFAPLTDSEVDDLIAAKQASSGRGARKRGREPVKVEPAEVPEADSAPQPR
jgi:hypothetical protein